MSAEVLRVAARLMRERAEAVLRDEHPDEEPWHLADDDMLYGHWGAFASANREDAEHIASWHPAVALAVADWLDACASAWHPSFAALRFEHAFTVARAYLGESA